MSAQGNFSVYKSKDKVTKVVEEDDFNATEDIGFGRGLENYIENKTIVLSKKDSLYGVEIDTETIGYEDETEDQDDNVSYDDTYFYEEFGIYEDEPILVEDSPKNQKVSKIPFHILRMITIKKEIQEEKEEEEQIENAPEKIVDWKNDEVHIEKDSVHPDNVFHKITYVVPEEKNMYEYDPSKFYFDSRAAIRVHNGRAIFSGMKLNAQRNRDRNREKIQKEVETFVSENSFGPITKDESITLLKNEIKNLDMDVEYCIFQKMMIEEDMKMAMIFRYEGAWDDDYMILYTIWKENETDLFTTRQVLKQKQELFSQISKPPTKDEKKELSKKEKEREEIYKNFFKNNTTGIRIQKPVNDVDWYSLSAPVNIVQKVKEPVKEQVKEQVKDEKKKLTLTELGFKMEDNMMETRTNAFVTLQQKQEPTSKTRMCKYEKCSSKNCNFAHSLEELNPTKCVFEGTCKSKDTDRCPHLHPGETKAQFICRMKLAPTPVSQPKTEMKKVVLKTKVCDFHLKGRCQRGKDCNFAHSLEELVFGECRFGRDCRFGNGCGYIHPRETKQQVAKRLGIKF